MDFTNVYPQLSYKRCAAGWALVHVKNMFIEGGGEEVFLLAVQACIMCCSKVWTSLRPNPCRRHLSDTDMRRNSNTSEGLSSFGCSWSFGCSCPPIHPTILVSSLLLVWIVAVVNVLLVVFFCTATKKVPRPAKYTSGMRDKSSFNEL